MFIHAYNVVDYICLPLENSVLKKLLEDGLPTFKLKTPRGTQRSQGRAVMSFVWPVRFWIGTMRLKGEGTGHGRAW